MLRNVLESGFITSMVWKTKSSKEVYRSKYWFVTEDKFVTDFGDEGLYSVVHKEPCALIIPREGEKFVLVGQYRYITKDFSWEFPAGHFQDGGIEKTANMELEEETGLRAGKLQEIGIFWPANGFLDQECHVFLATELSSGARNRDIGEKGMKIWKVSYNELEDMIKSNKIKDGLTLAAFSLLETRGLLAGQFSSSL